LYLAGARVEELYPISMLQVANGMNITAVSHGDQVDFGFLVDSKLVSDPWIYADGILTALRELEAAVASHSKMPGVDAASALSIRPESFAEEAHSATRAVEPPSRPEFEVEPLDLQLMISELSHLRAPPRKGISEVEDMNVE
jgi:hypothetical protein